MGIKLGVIGYGNMASAIVPPAVKTGVFSASDVYVCASRNADSPRWATVDASGFNHATELEVAACDVVMLAVKPQQLDELMQRIGSHLAGKCIVSIIVGVTIERWKRMAPGAYVLRTMPNTPITLGLGATLIAQEHDDIPDELLRPALAMFECSGITATLPEAKINEATGINGSSPAYFFLMAEAMTRAGVMQGIDEKTSLELAAAAMEGAAAMLRRTGKPPEQLRREVCSPGGTTLAALDAMERGGFSQAVIDGMLACTKRAYELA